MSSCLVNRSLYEDRLAALTDNDGDGWAEASGDCNDADPSVAPGAVEVCDGIDQDCDGLVDDDPEGEEWYVDADGDGFGGGTPTLTCSPGSDQVATGGDCDDSAAAARPDGVEACDQAGLDEDCDGLANDRDPDGATGATTWYIDYDGDGFGASGYTTVACDAPSGYVDNEDDCDDTAATVNPGETEACGNGADDDCDGTANSCTLSGDLDLAEADAVIRGGDTAYLGGSLCFPGDMDGDGLPDLAVGAMVYPGEHGEGAVMLFASPSGEVPMSAAFASLYAEAVGDFAGERVAGLGDVDGWSDLAVSAPSRAGDTGAVYVVFGPLSGALSLAASDARIDGASTGDALGFGLAGPGDMDGDGLADLLVTAYGDDGAGADAGAAWLLRGAEGGIGSLDDAVEWRGEAAGDYLMRPAGGEDLDGDGTMDVALGAPGWDGTGVNRGAVYLLLGPDLDRSLADADTVVIGVSDGAYVGYTVALPGDTDGDGLGDLAIGAPFDDVCGDGSGAVALFSGPVSEAADFGSADACLAGDAPDDQAGSALAGAGDVDGNGTSDLVIGAPAALDGRGLAWWVPTPARGYFALSSFGLRLVGEAEGDQAGWSVAGGDVNADGLADIAVGARLHDSGGEDGGSAYLVFGTGL